MVNEKHPDVPDPITPEQVRDVEAKCPNIVRFLRKAVGDPESPQARSIVSGIQEQVKVERAMAEAMHGRIALPLFHMFLAELPNQRFREGILDCFRDPDRDAAIRDFVKRWFEHKSVVFDYTEDDTE